MSAAMPPVAHARNLRRVTSSEDIHTSLVLHGTLLHGTLIDCKTHSRRARSNVLAVNGLRVLQAVRTRTLVLWFLGKRFANPALRRRAGLRRRAAPRFVRV